VTTVAFSADGKTLASGRWGGGAILCDPQTGKERRRYGQGELLAISPDGKTLALRPNWRELRVVDVATGKERCALQAGIEWFFAAAFDADGTTLFTGGSEGNLRVWQTAAGKEIRRFQAKATGVVYGLWLSADGRTCFSQSGYSPSTLQVWDAVTGAPLRRLRGLNKAAAVTPDGKTVVAGRKGDVVVWDPVTGKETKRFQGDEHHILTLGISPDGKTLALGGSFDTFRVFDVSGGKERLQWSTPGPVRELAFSADGKTLAAGGWHHAVRLWDCRTGKELLDEGHHAPVGALAFAPDGGTLVSLAHDHTVRAWGLAAGKETHRWGWQGGEADLGGIVALADGRSVALGSRAGRLRILDFTTGKERPCGETPQGTTPVALAPDGTSLLTRNMFKTGLTCTLWDMPRARKVREYTQAARDKLDGDIAAVALAPDGKTLASLSVHCRWRSMYRVAVACGLSLWEADTGKERRIDDFDPPSPGAYFPGQPWTLAFLDGGKTLVSVMRNGVMQFWDVATLKERRRHEGHEDWTGPLAFSPDGKLFASAGGDNGADVCVWQTATGKRLTSFSGHRGAVCAIAFSPDGRMLSSGSADTTILGWEVSALR
jgi:WD40 repeat protein